MLHRSNSVQSKEKYDSKKRKELKTILISEFEIGYTMSNNQIN